MKLFLCENKYGARKILTLAKIILNKKKGNYYKILKEVKNGDKG